MAHHYFITRIATMNSCVLCIKLITLWTNVGHSRMFLEKRRKFLKDKKGYYIGAS